MIIYNENEINKYATLHTIKEIQNHFNFPSYCACKRYLLSHKIQHIIESRKGENNNSYKHGGRGTRLYSIWCGMKSRCYNKNSKKYYNWGGRGICVCETWKNAFSVFRNWAIDNGYQDNLTIDRINNDKDYCPENCRWVTLNEQNNNQRTNIVITYKGKTQNLKQWSKELNLNYNMLLYRYREMNLSIKDLFEIPSGRLSKARKEK